MSAKKTSLPNLANLELLKGSLPSDYSSNLIVLEFWATWCPPCRKSIPHLTEIQHKFSDKGVLMIGISQRESRSTVSDFVSKMGNQMDYIVALDATGSVTGGLMQEFQVSGIPAAFIVNYQTSTVIWNGHPMDPEFEEQIERAARQVAAISAAKRVDSNRVQIRGELKGMGDWRGYLEGKSVKELKGIMQECGISAAGCVEKGDIVNKIASEFDLA
jgi:thiol-disulfide isomerase/thioredoxin